MNEPVENLFKQCKTDIKDEFGNWINHSVDYEKFAKLIVRECINVCESIEVGTINTQIERFTIRDCVRAIKQHFGVVNDIE